jgi:hypothetical protein
VKELNRSWFSNPRPLPLDENGKVDFSIESESKKNNICEFHPENQERFMGRMFDQISMPDDGRIICLYRWNDDDPDLPLEIENHNIFRLNSENKIIWRIKRVEGGYVNWESRNKHAKESNPNCDGYLDPFLSIGSHYFERRPLPDKGPFHPKFEIIPFDDYKSGRLLGAATNWWGYDINPDTGIATCNGRQMK